MDGCSEMGTNGVCASCAAGFFKYESQCVACHASCATCADSTYCLTCQGNYFFEPTNQNFAFCTMCPAGCATCTDGSTCTSCLSGYRFASPNCVTCGAGCTSCTNSACSTCSSGYALVSGTCRSCIDTLFGGSAGCTACDGGTSTVTCTACSSGYFLGTGFCALCSAAYSNSILCDTTKPLQCLNDLDLVLTNRYYLINDVCVNNANNCKMMADTAGKCSECYFSVTDNVFYRLDTSGACIKCNASGCATYSTDCTCQSCLPGYQFVNNQCIACQNLHCEQCANNTLSCTKCASSYGIFSTTCSLCLKSNCVNCDGDFSVCAQC